MRSRIFQLARSGVDRIRRTDYLVLTAVLAVLIFSGIFIEVADHVTGGSSQRLDDWALRALRQKADPSLPVGPAWLQENIRDLTALGGFPVLLIVTTAVVVYLWLCRTYHAMWLILGSAIGGQLLNILLKSFFDRPRPDLLLHLMRAENSSFPSGHSMNAAGVYLTLGLLLARLTDHHRLKVYYLTLATLLTLLVGASRVYLGVHYPTDVLAGWAAGAAWAAACWLLAGYLQRQGAVEQHPNEPVDDPSLDAPTTSSEPSS